MEGKIEAKLKRQEFNTLDSAFACVSFIILQFLFSLIYDNLPVSVRSNFFVALLASFIVEAVFFIAVIITSATRRVEFVKATKLNKKTDFVSILIAVAISFVCLFAFTGLTNVFVNFLYKLGYSSNASLSVPNVETYLLYIFLICICPAIFEDLLFRGLILSGLRELGDKKAIIFSALIFMLMHGGPDQTIHQFVIGIVLGCAFIASGSIWIPIVIHFMNNFVALTGAFITRNAEVVETAVPSWGQLALSLLYAVIMAAVGAYVVFNLIKIIKNRSDKKESIKNEESVKETESIKTEELNNDVEQNVSLSQNIKNEDAKSRDKKYSLLLFIVSGAYLIFNWCVALIAGFIL